MVVNQYRKFQHDIENHLSTNKVLPIVIGTPIFEEAAPDVVEQIEVDCFRNDPDDDEMFNALFEDPDCRGKEDGDLDFLHDNPVDVEIPPITSVSQGDIGEPAKKTLADSAHQELRADAVMESADDPAGFGIHVSDRTHDGTMSVTCITLHFSSLAEIVGTFRDPDADTNPDCSTWSGGREADYVKGYLTDPEGTVEYLVRWKSCCQNWKPGQNLIAFAPGKMYDYVFVAEGT
jgi:hypothetical protein